MTNLLYSAKHYQIKCAKSEERCKEYTEVLQNLLPNQSSNAGKYLTTDGTKPSWADVFSAINNIAETSGEITIEANKIYTMSVTGATTFSLATPNNTNVFNQIKVMMKVTGTPTITWGTTNFFNKTTPEIEEGSYDVYFDWDNLLGAWVCGVMAKGAAE